jgi:outer membrane protein OmpA-like peptidoglycan-associated protein
MKFRTMLAAATILALPIAAKAQPVTGLYVGAGGGLDIMDDAHGKLNTQLGTIGTTDFKTQIGPTFDLSVGYGLGNGLRAEVEGLYTYNRFSGANYGGQEQKYGPMVNVLYDFSFSPMIQPYVGVGGGYLWAQDSNLHYGGDAAQTKTKGDFAYQGIIGIAVPIPAAPGLAFTADYRFLGLVGDRHYPLAGAPGNITVDHDYNNLVTVGIRYAFGAAPPPAPVAPAAAVPASPVSRSYLVFFDWDKAVLTDRAKQIVSEAAANSTKVQYTKIEVNGYTDTSGTPAYNQGLSIRRAQAVAAELVKDGVPKAAIAIQGFGETHLLVQTGPGVREPQNRRVEIIIR